MFWCMWIHLETQFSRFSVDCENGHYLKTMKISFVMMHTESLDIHVYTIIVPVMCYIHFQTVAKICYFAHSSYHSPARMTEN